MARIGIIAAMFREVHPLVRNMKPLRYLPDRRVRLYQDDNATIAYAGMGREPAAMACRAALASGELSSMVSIGWAGGLNPRASSGRVVEPSLVIDSLSGCRYEARGNGGTLVTVQLIANLEEKRQLGEKFHGDYVDMEAATVAECAREAGLPFYCFKAISDEHDARLPDMNRFNRKGKFSVWRFIAYVGFRPAIWGVVSDMSRASLDSRDALCKRLKQWIGEGSQHSAVGIQPGGSHA
jgi:adenosylhomocysteine nucleosidase